MRRKNLLKNISVMLFFISFLNLFGPIFQVKAATLNNHSGLLNEERTFSDIQGHWAERQIQGWISQDLVGGYPDGTFRPNSPITRAEFLSLVNRVFNYSAVASQEIDYVDVTTDQWFTGEIAKAATVGYLGGYPDGSMRPNNAISRQEVAAVFAKILFPNMEEAGVMPDLLDQAEYPVWSENSIRAVVSAGYMGGYPDGTFRPTQWITRAEAVSALDRVAGTLYNHAGTYGPLQGSTVLEGNVTISTSGITLQNTTINGNLYLTEGIGEGDVVLKNVHVQGVTKISGGGSDSIHLIDSSVGSVHVISPSGSRVRLVAQGSTIVSCLEVRTPVKLEEADLSGSGFNHVNINCAENEIADTAEKGDPNSWDNEVQLLGLFTKVVINSPGQIFLQQGSIEDLELTATAQGTKVQLAKEAIIHTLFADADNAVIQGQGTVGERNINAREVTIELTKASKNKKKSSDGANIGPLDDFACSETSDTTAHFTWTAAIGAESLKIQQSTDGGETWEDATHEDLAIDAAEVTVTGLTASSQYMFRLVVSGGENAGESNSVNITTQMEPVGASWTYGAATTLTRLGGASGKTAGSDFDSIYPWSDMKLCNVADDGTINAYLGDASFTRDGSNGQVMVKIPRFYYKHTYEDGVHEFWVADWLAPGFKLHPAFIRAGEEKEYVLIGAYKASFGKAEDGETDTLASVSGKLPAVEKTIAEFRDLAEARGNNSGVNWTQTDILTRSAIAFLYLVEYADTDCQRTIGMGITDLRNHNDDVLTVASSDANTIIVSNESASYFSVGQYVDVGTARGRRNICKDRKITAIEVYDENNKVITVDGDTTFTTVEGHFLYHVGQKTGGCDSLNGVSGMAEFNFDGETAGADGKVSVSYRGMEDLWGNLLELVDGININRSEQKPYIADSNFASDQFDGSYVATEIVLPSENGYIKDFACFTSTDWLLMPHGEFSLGGDNNTYISDYYAQNWEHNSDKIAMTSGYWYCRYNAGLFYWVVNNNSSLSYMTVGTRLLLIP